VELAASFDFNFCIAANMITHTVDNENNGLLGSISMPEVFDCDAVVGDINITINGTNAKNVIEFYGETCPHCSFWSNIKKPDLFKTVKFSATQDQPTRILKVLNEAARNKKTLLYGDVMKSMGLAYQDAMHRKRFEKDLRVANRRSEIYEHGLLISALLVYKTQYIPDDDFFLMAQEQGAFTPGKDSKTAFFKDHLERIFNFYEKKEG